jgi:hypothetical protein
VRSAPIKLLVERHQHAADLSPRTWASLTLESWMRQEHAQFPYAAAGLRDSLGRSGDAAASERSAVDHQD